MRRPRPDYVAPHRRPLDCAVRHHRWLEHAASLRLEHRSGQDFLLLQLCFLRPEYSCAECLCVAWARRLSLHLRECWCAVSTDRPSIHRQEFPCVPRELHLVLRPMASRYATVLRRQVCLRLPEYCGRVQRYVRGSCVAVCAGAPPPGCPGFPAGLKAPACPPFAEGPCRAATPAPWKLLPCAIGSWRVTAARFIALRGGNPRAPSCKGACPPNLASREAPIPRTPSRVVHPRDRMHGLRSDRG